MMEKDNIILLFKGNITSDLLTSVLQIMESKMEYMEEPLKIKKRVYSILVECLQNLYHHIDNIGDNNEKKSAIFMIAKDKEGYLIVTGNYITKFNAKKLGAHLDKINTMSKEELKAHYKNVLINGEFSEKGGGGLGLIDIARKSGQKLDYNFEPVDNNSMFFSLKVKVAK